MTPDLDQELAALVLGWLLGVASLVSLALFVARGARAGAVERSLPRPPSMRPRRAPAPPPTFASEDVATAFRRVH